MSPRNQVTCSQESHAEQNGSFVILPALPPSPRIVLVTGASGFIGRALVEALAGDGVQVRALSRRASPELSGGPHITPVQADLFDASALEAALHGVTDVVHLAGVLGGSVEHLTHVNVDMTTRLAQAAIRARVSLVIHCSSAGVYGDTNTWAPRRETTPPAPTTPYEHSKLAGEHALRSVLKEAVPSIILRPAGVYGARREATLTFYRQVARRRVWWHGATVHLVHPTAVEDVVSAIRSALHRSHLAGRIFNVGGDRALPFTDLIALIAAHSGKSLFQPKLPAATTRIAQALASRGIAPTLMHRLAREVVNRSVDTDAAREALAFTPMRLEEGIAAVVAALQDER